MGNGAVVAGSSSSSHYDAPSTTVHALVAYDTEKRGRRAGGM